MGWEGPASDIDIRSLEALSERLQLLSGTTGEVHVDKKIFRLPESRARLTLKYSLGKLHVAQLECSLPKVKTGSNRNPLPLVEAMRVMRDVDEEAARYLFWEQPFQERGLYRIDATGHIRGVRNRWRILKSIGDLQGLPHPPQVRRDPRLGWAQSFACGPGSGSWKFIAYDKQAEIAHRMRWAKGAEQEMAHRDFPDSGELVRCELRLRKAELRRLQMPRAMDLREETLMQEHRRRFHEVGLGRSVMGMNHALQKIRRSSLSASDQTMLLGVLTCDLFGENPGLSDKCLRKHRKNARRLGIAIEDVQGIAEIVRLDYDRGIEVREAMS